MKNLWIVLLLLPALALASEKSRIDQTINSYNEKTVNKSIDVAANAESTSGASNGDQVSMNSSQFYALSLQFPELGNCFTGVQGGGQEQETSKGTSGFLGFHLLNNSCWMDLQAAKERDIELNARLLCNDRKYRAALGYDAKQHGVTKRERCITLKANSGRDQMQELTNQVERLKANNAAMLSEHAKIVDECEAANDRGDERLARCNERWQEVQHK